MDFPFNCHWCALENDFIYQKLSVVSLSDIVIIFFQTTRLGRYINELRKKTTDGFLAKRAKDLVRQWRHMILPQDSQTCGTVASSNHKVNGLNVGNRLSPGLVTKDVQSSGPMNSSTSPSLSPFANNRSFHLTVSPSGSSEKSTSPALQTSITAKSMSNSNLHPKHFRGLQPQSPSLHPTLMSDPVPKTHAANKRLRKHSVNDDEPPSKIVRQSNGGVASGSLQPPDSDIIGECSRDSFGGLSDQGSSSPNSYEVPKIRGRKMGSMKTSKTNQTINSSNIVPCGEDIVKEKIASIARTPRVKTTQELLAGLQAKTGVNEMKSVLFESKDNVGNSTAKVSKRVQCTEVSQGASEYLRNFDISKKKSGTDSADKSVSHSFSASVNSGVELTKSVAVEEKLSNANSSVSDVDPVDREINNILSQLPPINYESICWSDDEKHIDNSTSENLDPKDLFTNQIEGITGNYSECIDKESCFREWHECVSRRSYKGELLHILPYVVID